MKHLWEFCCIRKVTLRNIVLKFEPNRKNYRNLTDYFTNSGFYGLQPAAINRCRIYLKVIHLSYITTGDGRYISKAAYNGEITKWSTAQYEWPNQGRPGSQDWVEWRWAINSSFSVSLPTLILPLSYQPTIWDKDIPSRC